uniref:Uncharacterized protein n=1 Tax=Arundo donax TaxID=35708 RepID=A0A0A9HS48_ARUDO
MGHTIKFRKPCSEYVAQCRSLSGSVSWPAISLPTSSSCRTTPPTNISHLLYVANKLH